MRRYIPNVLTSLRFPLTGLFLFGWLQAEVAWHIAATAAFLVGMLTDMLDGIIARRMGSESQVGSFLDPLADKVLVIAGFYAIYATPEFDWDGWRPWILIAIVLIFMRELGITVLRTVKVRRDRPLITSGWGKLKTTVQMFTLIIAFAGLIARELAGIALPQFETLVAIGVFVSAVLATVSGSLYLRVTLRSRTA